MRRWSAAIAPVAGLVVLVGCRQVLGFEDVALFGLGATCTGSDSDASGQCPPEAPVCISLDGTTFLCTASCGNGPAGSESEPPVPPAGGDAICKSLASSAGTPVCNLAGEVTNGVVPWFCGILCGENLGGCPRGLTCTANVCQ